VYPELPGVDPINRYSGPLTETPTRDSRSPAVTQTTAHLLSAPEMPYVRLEYTRCRSVASTVSKQARYSTLIVTEAN